MTLSTSKKVMHDRREKVVNHQELPLRIQREIADQQYKSEILVSSVQLIVLAFLFTISCCIPVNYSPDAPVHSTALGLILFAILVLLRLWFAYTGQLNNFFLGFSIIAEMLLLIFIIWSYHLQYETTVNLDLKNPQIHFVYILIALRALRFEPRWVILSGFTAAFGWLLMVWQTYVSVGTKIFTWDFVTDATTNQIYLGSLFDVFLSIILMTLIIALVLKRARDTLYEAVAKKSAAKELARFLDPSVVKKITLAETMLQAGYGEVRHAAIMFTDLRGFTQLSNILTPSELIILLAEYQGLLVPIIQRNNGNIDKFLGDGLMASFGAVHTSKTYAADALRAVDEINKAIKVWNEKRQYDGKILLDVGIGLAAGEVIFGVMGEADRLEYTVIGETANLAAKLEKQNKIAQTKALTTKNTLLEALQQGYRYQWKKDELPKQHIIGMVEPIDLIILKK